MGKHRFAKSTARFAELPHESCVYVAEISGGIVKVGCASSARGRAMSLSSEVRRVHGAEVVRFHPVVTRGVKAAFEVEATLVHRIARVGSPLSGRREFFTGVAFEEVVRVLNELGAAPCRISGGVSQSRVVAVPPKVEQAKQPAKPARRRSVASRRIRGERKHNANNTTGYRGVYFDGRSGRYVAQVAASKKRHIVGRFATAEEANLACIAKRAELYGQGAA